MKHTTPVKGRSKSSFVQAVLLIVFLILGYLGYTALKKGGFSSGLNSFVNVSIEDFRPLQSMKETQKTALQKTLGGFWVCRTQDTAASIQKEDCLELRDNGIIWQVIRWQVAYPDQDTSVYYHVRYAFLNPYSIAADGRTIVDEVRTIRQVFIVDGDTCFGQSQVDELWQTRKDDSLLVLNRKRYQPYSGELTEFFPDGMIDLIDKLILNDCTHGYNLGMVVKDRLRSCYQTSEWTRTCDTSMVARSIHDYFFAAVVEEIFSTIPYFPSLPAEIDLPLRIQPDGSVILEMAKANRAQAGHFKELIYKGIEDWPVARCDAREMPRLHYIVTLPLP